MTFHCHLCAADVTVAEASWGALWGHFADDHADTWGAVPKWPDGQPVIREAQPDDWLRSFRLGAAMVEPDVSG